MKVQRMDNRAYNRTVATIRDYPRMVERLQEMREDAESINATSYDGMPKAQHSPGGNDEGIIRVVMLEQEVEKIQRAMQDIPPDMRAGVMNSILSGDRYPRNEWGYLVPSLNVWSKQKNDFIERVAKAFNFID